VKIDSRAVHAGREIKARDPLGPPIVQTSVYVFEDLEDYDAVASGEDGGHIYARNSNENVAMLEAAVADLEGAEAGVAAGSGMAALLLGVLALAPRPAPVVLSRDSYGTTLSLLRSDLQPLGYEPRVVDLADLESLAQAATGAALVIAETISNPLCRLADVGAVAAIARRRGAALLVDNTFATPVLRRPLEEGATAVVHSVTKFIGGHSDLVAGVLVGSREAMASARARGVRLGTTLGPFEAWLALRGLRTLPLRIARQSANAAQLAAALAGLDAVGRVYYPGLGAMLAFDLSGGHAAVQRMLDRLRLVLFAASLGGVETTVSPSALTSHRSLTAEERAEIGIGPGTVRVSAGIEDVDDLVADFQQALRPTP
jgi:cystathionine beta-lyase/cystathionine gamma-synthase